MLNDNWNTSDFVIGSLFSKTLLLRVGQSEPTRPHVMTSAAGHSRRSELKDRLKLLWSNLHSYSKGCKDDASELDHDSDSY